MNGSHSSHNAAHSIAEVDPNVPRATPNGKPYSARKDPALHRGLEYRVQMQHPLCEMTTATSSCTIFKPRRAAQINLDGQLKGNPLRSGRIEVWRDGVKLDAWDENQLRDETCGMMPDEEWDRLRRTLLDREDTVTQLLSKIGPGSLSLYQTALDCEVEAESLAQWFFDWRPESVFPIGLPFAPITPPLAVLPQQLQSKEGAIEAVALAKTGCNPNARNMIDANIKRFIGKLDGQLISVGFGCYIERRGTDVSLCERHAGSLIVGVSLLPDEPVRLVYKVNELDTFLAKVPEAAPNLPFALRTNQIRPAVTA